MNVRTHWLLALLALGMAACTRSASKGMPPTPTFQPITLATPAGPQAPVSPSPVVAGTEMPGPFPIHTPPGKQASPTPTPPPPTPTPRPQPTQSVAVTPLPTPTPMPTPALTVPERYTLHQGEHPYCLARRFNIHPDDLLAANGLSRGQRFYPGLTLTIPKNARPWPASASRALRAHPTTYTTVGGETLYAIACKFGDVWPEQIARANGIPLSELGKPLPAGTTLRIP